MMICFNTLTTLCLLVITQYVTCQRDKTIYQKIQQEPQYAQFNALIQSNRIARRNLRFEQLTVFVPVNEAIEDFEGELNSDLVYYHMSFEVHTLASLINRNSLASVRLENPPLWITKIKDDIYVNNAKILWDKSNYVVRNRDGYMGKQQVLHMIDEVLNPMIPSPKNPPSAFDFLSNPSAWPLVPTISVSSFFTKVKEHQLQHIYDQNVTHTYFVPLDAGIDTHAFRTMRKHILLGHVVPFYVLFTRPTSRNFAYETLTEEMVLSFVERDGKLFVRGLTREGEFYSEVVLPNLPVTNGVLHLIAEPLGIVGKPLKPFPYLPILEKLSNDPTVGEVYAMGERTGFNEVFSREGVNFTYLVPRDASWRKLREAGYVAGEKSLDVLKRHLVVGKSSYSVEQLVALTKASNFSGAELVTAGGPLRVVVVEIDEDYFLRWGRKYIKFLRPNYECTNGIIHILAAPLVELRRNSNVENDTLYTSFGGYWDTFKNAFYRILHVD